MLYEKFPNELSGDKRLRFDDDISRIIVINEISENSVNVKATEDISSIFVVLVELKNKEYNGRNIALISRLFGQKLLLVLHCGEEYQLVIYETQLLKSEWKAEEDIKLHIEGLDLCSVWNNLVTVVSGIIAENGKTLSEQIVIEAEKERLRKKITELESKTRREIQSKKKYDMYKMIKEYEECLVKLDGKEKNDN